MRFCGCINYYTIKNMNCVFKLQDEHETFSVVYIVVADALPYSPSLVFIVFN